MAQTLITVPPGVNLVDFAKEHLFYEVQMFLGGRAALPGTKVGEFAMNAMLEVCLLHLRNLIDFFYISGISRAQPDDVVADHYVSDWNTKRPVLTPALMQARERANKELAHLTTKRIPGTPERKAWKFGDLSKDLKPVVDAFLKNVDATFPANARGELRKI